MSEKIKMGILVALMPLEMILKALVLMQFLKWFAFPVWGDPGISLVHLIGLAAALRVLQNEGPYDTDDNVDFVSLIFYAFATPMVYLCFGWIISLFV